MQTIYFLWALLPLVLLLIAIHAGYKKVMKIPRREDGWDYFIQFLFCSAILVMSIFFDIYVFEILVQSYWGSYLHVQVYRWLIYPLLLTSAVWLQRLTSDKPERCKPKTQYIFRP